MREMVVACSYIPVELGDIVSDWPYVDSNFDLEYCEEMEDRVFPANPNLSHFLVRCVDVVADIIWQDSNVFVLSDVVI